MRPRSTFHNGLFALLGQVGSRLLGLAFFATFARKMGPACYGDYGIGVSFGVIFAVAIDPGLNPLLVRDGARDRSQLAPLANLSLGYKLAALAVAWPLMEAVAAACGYRDATLWAVALGGGTTLLVGVEDHAASVLVAQERNDLEGGLRLASKLLFAILGLAALALGLGFVGAMAALFVAQVSVGIGGLALAARTGVPTRPRLEGAATWHRVREALPIAATGALWMLTLRLDQLIASQLGVPRADLGDYNGAVKLVEALILFPSAVMVTFQPVMARTWPLGAQRCAGEVELALSASLGLTLPVAVGGALLARPLAILVYGSAFAAVGSLFAIQLLVLVGVAVQFSCFPALIAAGALRLQTKIVALNLVLIVALDLLLVPVLGVRGASWAAAIGGIAASIGCLVGLQQLGMGVRLGAAVWRPALSAMAMGAVLLAVGERIPLAARLALGALTYLAAMLLLGGGALVAALQQRRAPVSQPEAVKG